MSLKNRRIWKRRSGSAKKSELPSTLKKSDAKAQRTFAKAHDSAVKEYGEGERAHRVALLVERAHLLEGSLLLSVQIHRHGVFSVSRSLSFAIFDALGVCAEQGRRDSNPRPSVLETDALPAELLPSDAGGA